MLCTHVVSANTHHATRTVYYPFVEIVAAELDSGVGDDADAVGPIASHEPSPSLLSPHLAQCLSNGQLVSLSSSALDLHQNF